VCCLIVNLVELGVDLGVLASVASASAVAVSPRIHNPHLAAMVEQGRETHTTARNEQYNQQSLQRCNRYLRVCDSFGVDPWEEDAFLAFGSYIITTADVGIPCLGKEKRGNHPKTVLTYVSCIKSRMQEFANRPAAYAHYKQCHPLFTEEVCSKTWNMLDKAQGMIADWHKKATEDWDKAKGHIGVRGAFKEVHVERALKRLFKKWLETGDADWLRKFCMFSLYWSFGVRGFSLTSLEWPDIWWEETGIKTTLLGLACTLTSPCLLL
jgi:hypothetical protein